MTEPARGILEVMRRKPRVRCSLAEDASAPLTTDHAVAAASAARAV